MTKPVERFISGHRNENDGGPIRKVVPEIDAFLEHIFKVYEQHGMSISHEDHHGGFEIESSDEDNKYNREWLNQASDNRSPPTRAKEEIDWSLK